MLTTTIANHATSKARLGSVYERSHKSEDLKSVTERYLYHCKRVKKLADSTLVYYELYTKQFREYMESAGMTNISDVTNMDCDVFFIDLSDHLEDSSLNLVKRVVKNLVIWCRTYIKANINVVSTEIRETKVRDAHPNKITHDQIQTVIRKTKDRQDKLMISVMYESGLRISELKNMKIEHIKGREIGVVGKGGVYRPTFINQRTANEVRAWVTYNGWGDGCVFRPTKTPKPGFSHTDSIRKRIKKLFWDILGITVYPHMIRRAFALYLYQHGCGLRTIQKLLGHARIETTMIYLNIDKDYLGNEHEKFFRKSVYA